MSIEIRAAKPDEMDQFKYVANYVFAEFPDPAEPEEPFIVQAEWSTCAFDDGKCFARFLAIFEEGRGFSVTPL